MILERESQETFSNSNGFPLLAYSVYAACKKGWAPPEFVHAEVDVTAKGKLLCFFNFWVSRTNEIQLVILFLSVQAKK